MPRQQKSPASTEQGFSAWLVVKERYLFFIQLFIQQLACSLHSHIPCAPNHSAQVADFLLNDDTIFDDGIHTGFQVYENLMRLEEVGRENKNATVENA